jgi:adenylate cyclase
LTVTWSRLGHEIGFGIGIAHGFATLGTIGFEGRFDYAAIGTVSNVASRLCDEAKSGQILISPRVLMKVENAVKVEPVGEFELKGIRRAIGGLQCGRCRTRTDLSRTSKYRGSYCSGRPASTKS